MNKPGDYFLRAPLVLAATVFFTLPVHAEPPKLSAELKTQYVHTDDVDLDITGGDDTQDSQSLNARVRVSGKAMERIPYLVEARGVKNYGDGGGEDPLTGEPEGNEDFLELRQAWVGMENIFNQQPLTFKIGRQRISEPYGLWWNRDQDALKFEYKTTSFTGFAGIGENLASYRTTHDDFNEDDENIFRAFGEGSWQWRFENFVDLRLLYQDDHSDMENPGTVVRSDDRDINDAQLGWAGVRFHGPMPASIPDSSYRFDIMGVAGNDDLQLSTAGPGGSRTVTGSRDRDVRGWALDAAASIGLPLVSKPALLLGYAFGSGDDDPADGTDEAFRQTGLDTNYNRIGAASSAFQHYGTVLRPDLSNIHILSAGISAPVFKASDLTFMYHYYRLDEKATALATSGVDAPLDNDHLGLGHGADLIFNVNLADEFSFKAKPVERVDFRTSLGIFKAGSAYGTADGETSGRALVEVVFGF